MKLIVGPFALEGVLQHLPLNTKALTAALHGPEQLEPPQLLCNLIHIGKVSLG